MISNKITIVLTLLLTVQTLFAKETKRIYLSGKGKNTQKEWQFKCTGGRKSGEWNTIPVPSCWELEGFGKYTYGYNYDEADEKGMYKYEFDVPESWKGEQVNIVFEGSMTDTKVKINGKKAGEKHQGAFYRFSYNISDLLDYGEKNLLEVTVAKNSSNKSVNKAERLGDYWVFGGIYRPVYLEVKPEQNIDYVAIDAKANGKFSINVYFNGKIRADKVRTTIYPLNKDKKTGTLESSLDGKTEMTNLKGHFENIKTWNPESPDLYKVKTEIVKNGNVVHRVWERFGFRTVDVRPKDGIYVNGTKIMFKGINRHSFWPSSGRTMSKKLSIEDVKMIKDMNMNAVRMSHYPPDEHFLNVCDSLGLFVLNELAGWHNAYDEKVGEKLVKEMITDDVNHPSIVMWNNGNEGGWNKSLEDDMLKYDPQKRPVIYPWSIQKVFDNQHYLPYNCCNGSFYNGDKIFFPTEFLHGLYDGGHGAGLEDQWEMMMENPLSAGGFLWVFADEGVVRTDLDDSIDTHGNSAPDGIVSPYHKKEASFFTVKEIWSPVYIAKENIGPQFDGKIDVENRYLYTDLINVDFKWKIKDMAGTFEDKPEGKTVAKGKAGIGSVKPGHKGTLSINLPDDWKKHDVLYLTAVNQYGNEIYTWSWAIKSPSEKATEFYKKEGNGEVKVEKNVTSISVEASGVKLWFDKNTGKLEKVNNSKGEVSFAGGPVLAAGESKFKKLKHYKKGDAYVVEQVYEGDVIKSTFTMYPSGWVKFNYRYLINGEFDYLGVNFEYPEEKVKGVKYMGDGPYRVWKNRMKGQELGVWQKDYNNTVTGESWDYPEFKGYYSDFYWAELQTTESPIRIVNATPNVFLRLYTPIALKNAYNGAKNPPFPEGDISFLHGISPIGTKFRPAEGYGPDSQKNIVFSRDSNPTYKNLKIFFDFGVN